MPVCPFFAILVFVKKLEALYIIAVFLSLCPLSIPTYAAPLLTWQQAKTQLKSQNINYKQAELSLVQMRLKIDLSRAAYYPQLGLNSSATLPFQTDKSQSFSAGLQLTQKLFPLLIGQPESELALAQYNAQLSQFQLSSASLRNALTTAFYRYEYAESALTLAQKVAKRRTQTASLIYARFLAGREHKGTYLRVKAQANMAEVDVIQARLDLALATTSIYRLLNLHIPTSIDITSPPKSKPTALPPDFATLARSTPTYLNAQALLQAALANQKLARYAYYPQLNASILADNTWTEPVKTPVDTVSGRLTLTLPLFLGGKKKADLRYTQKAVEWAELALQNAEWDAHIALQSAYNTAFVASESLRVQREVVEAAQTRASIAQAQYTAGLISYDTWDIIENDAIAQDKLLLIKERDAGAAMADYELQTGKGLDE